MDRNVNVVAAIIVRDGRILAAQRGHGELAGGWEFPGGKIESGETPTEACIREIREELDIDIDGLKPFMTLEYGYPSFHMHLETFTCSPVDQACEPTLKEHLDLRWLEIDELDSVAWLPADTQVANALRVCRLNAISEIAESA